MLMRTTLGRQPEPRTSPRCSARPDAVPVTTINQEPPPPVPVLQGARRGQPGPGTAPGGGNSLTGAHIPSGPQLIAVPTNRHEACRGVTLSCSHRAPSRSKFQTDPLPFQTDPLPERPRRRRGVACIRMLPSDSTGALESDG